MKQITEKRDSGIALIGDLPWGSHFCQFYQTKKDLLDVLVPYFRAGLENNELCVWVTSNFLTTQNALKAMKQGVSGFPDYLAKGQIEILPYTDFYLKGGSFDLQRKLDMWMEKHDQALAKGFDGMRVSGNSYWIDNKKDWDDFADYEAAITSVIGGTKLLVLCTYSLKQCGVMEIVNVVKNHEFALVRNGGRWEVIKSSEAQVARDALKRSEEKLQSLFGNMSEGFAYHRIVLDGAGKPCDYVFLEINEAFERLTGLAEEALIGKRATQAIAGIEHDPIRWIERCGEVALSGKPVQFESYSTSFKRWYSASIFSPHKGYFAVTLNDITERKQAEEALRVSEQRVRLKLDSILAPEGDIGTLDLADLIDAPAIQSLMEQFHQFAGIPMAIIDLAGKVLVDVGWSTICTRFHRVNPETCRFCLESDMQLARGVAPGEFKVYKCKNNMWDVATPIMVGDQHVGNLFTGQFFFDGEPLDRELFRAQANRYGFDEAEYLAALETVPRLSRESLDAGMAFFLKLAHMISQLSYSNIKLARSLAERADLMASLTRERTNLQTMFDGVNVGLLLISEDGVVQRINNTAARWVGKDLEAESRLQPGDFLGCIHAHNEPAGCGKTTYCALCPIRNTFEAAFCTGRPIHDVETEVILALNGEEVRLWFEVSADPLVLDGKRHVILAMNNITARKRAEDALRESQADLNRAQAVAYTGSWRLEVGRNELRWSDETYRIFGIPLGTPLTYEMFLAAIHPEDQAGVNQAWQAAMDGELYDIEHRIMAGDAVKWVREKAELEFTSERALRGGFGTVQDITDRKRDEEALRRTAEDLGRSNQDLEQFAYVASHDLQEPLRMVTGFVELLAEAHQGKLGEQSDTYIKYAVDGAHRMQILIDDLLAYSRVGTQGGEIEPTAAGEALALALASLQAAIGESGATITRGELPTVKADRRQLAQLFQNLVGNAIKFRAAAPPRIQVEARREEECWVFSIKDNGIGIDSEFNDRIFLIFQRLHTRQKYAGTGIGLAICKKIVERHGGRIWLESEPGHGATFNFTIPD